VPHGPAACGVRAGGPSGGSVAADSAPRPRLQRLSPASVAAGREGGGSTALTDGCDYRLDRSIILFLQESVQQEMTKIVGAPVHGERPTCILVAQCNHQCNLPAYIRNGSHRAPLGVRAAVMR